MACCAVLLEPKFPNISLVFCQRAYLVPEHVEIDDLVVCYWSSILISEPERAYDFALKKASPAQ